jgi:uncharacterized membrane protein
MDNIQKNGMIGFGICVLCIGTIIGIASLMIGYKKTLKYIHTNIFDEHMVINITMNIGLIAALLGVFFFTYAAKVEEDIVKANAKIAVSDIMDTVGPLLNKKMKKDFKNNLVEPDQSAADKESSEHNTHLMHDAMVKLFIILDIGLTIGFIISIMYEHSFIKILGLNLLIVLLVGCTEYIFLNFLPAKFISVDTNYIRWKILTKLKSKIYINNKPLA